MIRFSQLIIERRKHFDWTIVEVLSIAKFIQENLNGYLSGLL